MKAVEIAMAIVIAWVLIWSVIAVSLASSATTWILVVGSGALPPLMILWLWHPSARPALARVRQARR